MDPLKRVIVCLTLVITLASCVYAPVPATTQSEPLSQSQDDTSDEILSSEPILENIQTPTATPILFNTYTNEAYGYVVAYPQNWYPSGITYANAFEIRNYPPLAPDSVLEWNRASIIFVDTVNDSAAATDAYLASQQSPDHAPLTLDGHRAIRIHRGLSARQLGPGSAAAAGANSADTSPVPTEVEMYHAISTYVANGEHLLSIEASAPISSDAIVVDELLDISDHVTFFTTD